VKFLTMAKFKPGMAADPKMVVAINEAAKEWIKAHLADKSLDCLYNALPNASGYYGMAVSNASSIEEANALLLTYPGYFISDFEVYPLSDVMRVIDETTAATRKMMSMMGG
jgi:hypothetical protein